VVRALTPDALVHTLNKEVAYAMAQPRTRKRFEDLGFQFLEMPADQFTKYIRSEAERWGRFVRTRNISAD
jgi:tripartite-type tricarboxylate transporter receptor subunit TctC